MDAPEGWSEVKGALQREFRFRDFAEALAFVNRVGEAAEAADHHPDIAGALEPRDAALVDAHGRRDHRARRRDGTPHE